MLIPGDARSCANALCPPPRPPNGTGERVEDGVELASMENGPSAAQNSSQLLSQNDLTGGNAKSDDAPLLDKKKGPKPSKGKSNKREDSKDKSGGGEWVLNHLAAVEAKALPSLEALKNKPWFPLNVPVFSRAWLMRLFDDPQSSTFSLLFSLSSSFFVLLSCIAMICSTLPEYRYPRYGSEENDTASVFDDIELVCTVFFTIEYIVRVACASSMTYRFITGQFRGEAEFDTSWRMHVHKTWIFMKQPMNVIDLLAILPFYLESVVGARINLTSLRVGRLLRLVRLSKRNKMIPLFIAVISESSLILAQVCIIIFIFILFFAFCIFICEEGNWSDTNQRFERSNLVGESVESPYISVFTAIWFVVVTCTTVGYGDLSPTTVPGRIVGAATILLSLVLFAVPITIITSVFMENYSKAGKVANVGDNLTRLLIKRDGERFALVQRRGLAETGMKVLPWFPQGGSLRERLFRFAEDITASKGSIVSQLVVAVFIILSCVSMALESLPAYKYPRQGSEQGDTAPGFFITETLCVAVFTVEILLRLFTVTAVRPEILRDCTYDNVEDDASSCRKLVEWARHPLTIVDLASTIPFYVELILGGFQSLTFLRVLRLLRVARITRLSRFNFRGIVILARAIEKSMLPLASLCAIFAIWIVFASSIIFYCEQGEWDANENAYMRDGLLGDPEKTPYLSIVHTFWWMVVSMSTVGYGDMYPTSTTGRIAASAILFLSIVCLAVPISLVAIGIETAHSEYNEGRRKEMESDKVPDPVENPSLAFYDQIKGLFERASKDMRMIKNLLAYHNYDPTVDTCSADLKQRKMANLLVSPRTAQETVVMFHDFEVEIKNLQTEVKELMLSWLRMLFITASNPEYQELRSSRMIRQATDKRQLFQVWRVYTQMMNMRRRRGSLLGDSDMKSKAAGLTAKLNSRKGTLDMKQMLNRQASGVWG